MQKLSQAMRDKEAGKDVMSPPPNRRSAPATPPTSPYDNLAQRALLSPRLDQGSPKLRPATMHGDSVAAAMLSPRQKRQLETMESLVTSPMQIGSPASKMSTPSKSMVVSPSHSQLNNEDTVGKGQAGELAFSNTSNNAITSPR